MTIAKKKRALPPVPLSGRTWFGDVLAEFWGPEKPSGKVLILCDGCPSVPKRSRLGETLAKKGYWVFHMRYRGSWESRGRFLKYSPAEDVRLVARGVRSGFKNVYDGTNYILDVRECVVVGASFGGAAAVIASTFPEIDKAVALAPVIDWKAESKAEPFARFVRLVEDGFGMAYRPEKVGLSRLRSGTFFQPAKLASEIESRKLLVVHAKDDGVVPAAPLREFAKRAKVRPIWLAAGGHMGASDVIRKDVWPHVKEFLKAKKK